MSFEALYHDDLGEVLQAWEFKINSYFPELPYLRIRNNVDREGPPVEFTFINQYTSSYVDLHLNDKPVIGCDCENCHTADYKICCPGLAGCKPAYGKDGCLIISSGNPIYECNIVCKCDDECVNKVVQNGQTLRLEIFRTSNGTGWGLRTLEPIKKGQFVLEYLGEIIHMEEVERREEHFDYDRCSYLFNLDFNDKNSPYTVDATHYGNAARFINHSCSPNLEVYPVWINHLDPDLPRLAIFALRDVNEGEELSFDYKMSQAQKENCKKKKKQNDQNDDEGRTLCKCGAKNCKKFLN